MAMAKNDKRTEVRQLISLGREKGYPTYEEVNDVLPPDVVSPEQIDDLMLLFAFMDPIMGRERTLQFLRDYATETEAYLATLRTYLHKAGDTMPPCGRLAMEQGIAGYEMNAQWARRAIVELTDGGRGPGKEKS